MSDRARIWTWSFWGRRLLVFGPGAALTGAVSALVGEHMTVWQALLLGAVVGVITDRLAAA